MMTIRAIPLWLLGVVASAAIGAGVMWWGLAPRIDLAEQGKAHVDQLLIERDRLLEAQGLELQNRQVLITSLEHIQRSQRELDQAVRRAAQQHSKDLQELKKDEAIADYLSADVPARLGSLYQRPETTDPAAYTRRHTVPPNTMPPASSSTVADK